MSFGDMQREWEAIKILDCQSCREMTKVAHKEEIEKLKTQNETLISMFKGLYASDDQDTWLYEMYATVSEFWEEE